MTAYKLWIKTTEEKSVLVDRINETECIEGREYNPTSESHDTHTELESSYENLSRVTVRHYYKCETLEYDSLFLLALLNFSGLDKLKVNIKIALSSAVQLIHNSKTIHIKTRHELLRFIVNKYGTEKDFGLLMLSTAMYSLRFFKNPQRPNIQKKIQLYLDSFVASGELEIKNYRYRITGKAIVTLEQFEIDERRHRDSLKNQRRVLWLTIVIALSAVIQAGIIKLKPFLDLSQ